MTSWLIDTGPIVAYLDSSDRAHERIATALEGFRGVLVTSGAVLTEAMFLLSGTAGGPKLLAQFVRESRIRVFDLAQANELWQAAELMEQYGDTPMDYADATLVLLADALRVNAVLTLDRRGFSTYRTRARKTFKVLPEDY